MSGQEQLLKKVLDEMQEIKANMATKKDLEDIKVKLDKLSEKMDAHQIENINSDNLLLNEIQALREGVSFVNRKVADAELEINYLKQSKQ
jgi:ribosome-interacting GTPase 1